MNGGSYIGGVPPTYQNNEAPPHWLIYFAVADADKTFQKATDMQAKMVLPPTDVEGVGRVALLADPQGAAFALFQGSA